ncbi:MAG: hypothetical protein AB7S38_39780 [Vulcanimicrobiota bacterium]
MMITATKLPAGSLYKTQQTPPQQPPTQPEPPAADPVADAYTRNTAYLGELKGRAEAGEQNLGDTLRAESAATKQAFKTSLGECKLPTSAEEARNLTLAAMQAGMMAGALDGAVLMAVNESLTAEQPSGIPSFDEMMEELGKIWEQAKAALKELGVGALEQMSAGGRSVSAQAYDNAEMFVGREDVPVQAFQAYLSGAFAAGYATSAIDGVLLFKAGQ